MNSKKKRLLFLIILLVIMLMIQCIVALLIIGILLYFGVLFIGNHVFINKLSKKVDEKELETIETEFKNPLLVQKGYYVLTDHYIIIQQSSYIGMIKYEEVVLVYEQKLYNGTHFSNTFVLVTNQNKKFYIVFFDRKQITEVENMIQLKNDKVLFGFYDQNINQIKDEYGFLVKK